MSLAELKEKYRRLSALEKARSGWEGEYDASSKQVAIIRYKLLLVFMVFYYYAQCLQNELNIVWNILKSYPFLLLLCNSLIYVNMVIHIKN